MKYSILFNKNMFCAVMLKNFVINIMGCPKSFETKKSSLFFNVILSMLWSFKNNILECILTISR